MRRHAIALFAIVIVYPFAAIILAQGQPAVAKAGAVYSDRESFLAAVGKALTDDYTGYGVDAGTAIRLTNDEMTAIFGETAYESTSFSDLNLVGNIFIHGDGSNYCAGCNGNFRLRFDNTSFSKHRTVFGVGVDIVLHTSRRTAVGDVDPGETSLEGTVVVEFGDGEIRAFSIPADVGFFGPDPYFFGLTDRRGIRAITVGVEPLPLRHRWIVDNLTIAAAPKGKKK